MILSEKQKHHNSRIFNSKNFFRHHSLLKEHSALSRLDDWSKALVNHPDRRWTLFFFLPFPVEVADKSRVSYFDWPCVGHPGIYKHVKKHTWDTTPHTYIHTRHTFIIVDIPHENTCSSLTLEKWIGQNKLEFVAFKEIFLHYYINSSFIFKQSYLRRKTQQLEYTQTQIEYNLIQVHPDHDRVQTSLSTLRPL